MSYRELTREQLIEANSRLQRRVKALELSNNKKFSGAFLNFLENPGETVKNLIWYSKNRDAIRIMVFLFLVWTFLLIGTSFFVFCDIFLLRLCIELLTTVYIGSKWSNYWDNWLSTPPKQLEEKTTD